MIQASVMVDPLGRLTQQTDGDGRVIQISRDAFGRQKQVTPVGSPSYFEDGESFSVPDIGWIQSWSLGGRLLSQTDPQGNTVSWTHDDAGRALSATSTLVDGSSTIVHAPRSI